MRKILQRLLSKLFIVSTIIIIQMIWWFFLFYTASVASRVFQDLLYVAAILLSLYIVNRRMKMYIKMSWIFLILSVPIVGIPCYFFFGRPELTSKTQKRMARIVEAYAPLRPENELLNETLRQIWMHTDKAGLSLRIRNIHCMRRTAQSTLNQVRRLLRAF